MADSEVRTLCAALTLNDKWGVVRLEEWPEGLVLWVGGKIRWQSSRDAELWNVRPEK
jgi:hypothetical protein